MKQQDPILYEIEIRQKQRVKLLGPYMVQLLKDSRDFGWTGDLMKQIIDDIASNHHSV